MHVYLLRHAEDTGSGVAGCHPRRLTPAGLDQATRAAAWLRHEQATEVRTGTLERALHTAEIVCHALGLFPQLDPRLNEIAIAAGTTAPPPRERRPRQHPRGDESWEEFLDRVAAAISDLCRDPAPERRVVLVTHSGVFDAVHELLRGGGGRAVELAVRHAAITHWEYRPASPAGTWLLHRHNARPYCPGARSTTAAVIHLS